MIQHRAAHFVFKEIIIGHRGSVKYYINLVGSHVAAGETYCTYIWHAKYIMDSFQLTVCMPPMQWTSRHFNSQAYRVPPSRTDNHEYSQPRSQGLHCRDANLWRSKIWRFFPSGLPTPPPWSSYPLPSPHLPPKTHPPIPQQLLQNTRIFCRHCELAGKQGTYVNNFYWLIGDPIKQSVIWLW